MTFRVSEIVETEYGEKAILEIEYDDRSWVQCLPWGEGKFGEAGVPQTDRVPDYVAEAAEEFDWPEDYEAHQSWEDDHWEIDVEALETALRFWQAQTFNVEIATDADFDIN